LSDGQFGLAWKWIGTWNIRRWASASFPEPNEPHDESPLQNYQDTKSGELAVGCCGLLAALAHPPNGFV
jgi:hypothetical protein